MAWLNVEKNGHMRHCWKVVGSHFRDNKLHDVWLVHRHTYSLISNPIFLAVSEAFPVLYWFSNNLSYQVWHCKYYGLTSLGTAALCSWLPIIIADRHTAILKTLNVECLYICFLSVFILHKCLLCCLHRNETLPVTQEKETFDWRSGQKM